MKSHSSLRQNGEVKVELMNYLQGLNIDNSFKEVIDAQVNK